jgi:release factor glutamine methyltransferase
MIYYGNLKLITHPEVYEPGEDSLLLAENLKSMACDSVLDMGSGVGLLALVASGKARSVLGVDINPTAVETAKENARLNGILNVRFKVSDLFENIRRGEGFDLIVFNPPYLPVREKDALGLAWSGGRGGLEVVERFIASAPEYLRSDGSILMLVSSLNNPKSLRKKLADYKLRGRVVASRRFFFEELYVMDFKACPPS